MCRSKFFHYFIVLGVIAKLKFCEGLYKEFVDNQWIPDTDLELRELGVPLSSLNEGKNGFGGNGGREKRAIQTFQDMRRAPVSTPKKFIEDIVKEHNRLRDLHEVPPLTYDPELAKTAQFWANYLGNTSEGRTLPVLFRKGWFEIGGSIWASVGRKDANHISPTFAWYKEERWYSYGQKYCKPDPEISDRHTDHFTQMIWRETKNIGCAKFKNKSKHIYVVCHYSPPGNVRGEYEENVPEPKRAE